MLDYPRLLGGRRQGKKSSPLSIEDAPGKHQLVEEGHYYKRRVSKDHKSLPGVKLSVPFCVRRFHESAGNPFKTSYLEAKFKFVEAPSLVTPLPKIVFEVEGFCSCTDSREAQLQALVVGKQVVVHQRN